MPDGVVTAGGHEQRRLRRAISETVVWWYGGVGGVGCGVSVGVGAGVWRKKIRTRAY